MRWFCGYLQLSVVNPHGGKAEKFHLDPPVAGSHTYSRFASAFADCSLQDIGARTANRRRTGAGAPPTAATGGARSSRGAWRGHDREEEKARFIDFHETFNASANVRLKREDFGRRGDHRVQLGLSRAERDDGARVFGV